MKIFIAGATGRVAHFLIAELLSAGHEITAGVRNPDKFETTNPSINVQKMDLHASVPEFCDVVVGDGLKVRIRPFFWFRCENGA